MVPVAQRLRRSLSDIQADYDAGNTAELEALMRAWQGVKALPASDPRSFFTLGGYHGEPFRGPGETDPQWWGGYCQHGTVLFPTWHRAYLFELENALRSIPGCADVTLPFWDECSADTLANGIPSALTAEFFTLDGQQIPNPLRSFVLPVDIVDQVQGDNPLYSKPAGYETVRYPLSGLVGTAADRAATAAHNAQYADPVQNVAILNGNITDWLTRTVTFPGGGTSGQVYGKFLRCLDAPSYTLFSNTTSMGAWNKANPANLVTALESPHNSIHLAVGGFDIPGARLSPIPGANGDMGENDTAGLDPIFYFHHCFIDYTFWTWQRRHGATTALTIDPQDPGAVYVLGGNNAPPAGADANAPITMQTTLDPFLKADGTSYTSTDCINIETLGYNYGPGSLDSYAQSPQVERLALARTAQQRTLHVAGINRGKVRGSFVIAAYATIDGQRELIGHEAVLSRWQVAGCANCQSHLGATADFVVSPGKAADGHFEVEVRTRDSVLGAGALAADGAPVVATRASKALTAALVAPVVSLTLELH